MIQVAESFGWCIVQVTAFAAVAAVIYAVVKRQPANLNVLVLAGSLMVVAFLTLACIAPWPRWKLSLPMPVRPAPADVSNVDTVDTTLVVSENTELADKVQPTDAASTNDNIRAPQTTATTLPAEISQANSNRPRWLLAVLVAWFAATIGTVRLLIGLKYLHRYRRNSIPIDDPALQAEFDTLRDSMGAPAAVEVSESPTLQVAATLGWRRPLILLPAGWRAWTPDERRAVLAHELAHVAQRHFPLLIAGQIAIVPHFYHPLVHWLGRRLRLEQEIAADRLAAESFGSRHRYLDALAGLALQPLQPARAFSGLGLFMSRPLLMRRIAMLRRPDSPPRRRSHFVRTFAIAFLALAALAAAGLRAAPRVVAADHQSAGYVVTTENKETVVRPTGEPKIKILTENSTSEPAAPYIVTALIQISRQPTSLTNTPTSAMTDAGWKTYCTTQIELMKSNLVLQAAVHDPAVASLPILAGKEDPAAWLGRQLGAYFEPDSEILAVEMLATKENGAQVKQLIDAVIHVYEREVVGREQQYQMAARDALAKSVSKMSVEIMKKMEIRNAIAKEVGAADSGSGQVLQQLDIKRLERIEEELMRLENESLHDEILADAIQGRTPEQTADAEFLKRRITQLSKMQQELEEKIVARSDRSVDLTVKSQELDQLQQIAHDMSIKLETMDVEASAPSRIRVIQPATMSHIEPGEAPAN